MHGRLLRNPHLPLAILAILILIVLAWYLHRVRFLETYHSNATSPRVAASDTLPAAPSVSESSATKVYAHNLLLRKGPSFRVYINWLRGRMTRAHPNVNPSFDDPESFFLDVEAGVIRADLRDINSILNASAGVHSPLRNITVSGEGNQIKLQGTLHKIISLPIELTATIATVPDNRIHVHVTKLNVLKIPFKALLGGFHISVADLFHPQGIRGIQVSGNDLFFDTQKLLPPPHLRGRLSSVRVVGNKSLEEVYGAAQTDVARVEQWRNFLRLREGTIDFGKLTMHHVDLVMIDISDDAWFDLDLNHYQAQLVNGYTRMTPQAGLQIFMPDLEKIPHDNKTKEIGLEWVKNRNVAPPAEVTPSGR